MRTLPPAVPFLVVALCGFSAHAIGPGFGNLAWPADQLDEPVGVIHSVGASNGHGNVTMVQGYLLVIASSDGGGSPTDGALEFWDVSNPASPALVNKIEDDSTHMLREAHGFSIAHLGGRVVLAAQGGGGVLFFDVTDAPNASLLSYLDLPGIDEGDYSGDWWTFFQAPWLYVAGTDSGLYVVDASDVLVPSLAAQVPTGELAGVSPAQVFALGNLLVVMEAQSRGLATLDISNPVAPRVIRQLDADAGYSHLFAGDGKILTSGNIPPRIAVHQVSESGNIAHVATFGLYFNSGGYGSYQDGFFLSGFSDRYVKIDLATQQEVGSGSSGFEGRDEDFATVLGNLVFAGDDHGKGTALIAHQTAPDTTAPSIAWMHPPADAADLALTTRIGLSFSDHIDAASLTDETVVLTDASDTRVDILLSSQLGLVNVSPTAPLLANSTYHLVVEGVRDIAGNPSARFEADLTTGSGAVGVAPEDAVTSLETSSVLGASTLAVFHEGVATYVDRDFSYLAGFPPRFDGQPTIQTRNNDKLSVSADFMTFTLAVDAEVAVLYDARASGTPDWLAAFAPTGEQVQNDDAPYNVYSAMRSAGAVTLGGNRAAGADGAESMYAVVIVPASLQCTLALAPALEGDVSLSVSAPSDAQVSWQVGGALFEDAGASVTAPLQAGRHAVIVTVAKGPQVATCSAVQVVHRPLVATPARTSEPLLWTDDTHVASVNADNGTVTLASSVDGSVLWEVQAGLHPVALSRAMDGALWVLDREGARIIMLDPQTGARGGEIALPRASRPVALVHAPDGRAFVTLEATGELLALDPSGAELARVFATPTAGGLTWFDERLYVSRTVSSPARGEIVVVDAGTLVPASTITLALDAGPDTEASGRGVLTQLSALRVSADGTFGVVGATKANVQRGVFRDGQPLTFESRVRSVVAFIDLATHVELIERRLDINDRDRPQALALSPFADVLFIAAMGNNALEAFDITSGRRLMQLPVGRAPVGLALRNGHLAVAASLSRELYVLDVAGLLSGAQNEALPRFVVSTVGDEQLAPLVLRGKQIFHDASDRRMSKDGYIACASCHPEGGHDGLTWDFTQAGEGLRNTISLHGRSGLGHGRVHWTANFDEIQDFENDIRNGFAGTGFLSDAQFVETSDPLGAPKAGLSADLDALAAYVSSLDTVPASPHREASGALTDGARRGRVVFSAAACTVCHGGETFTDGLRHDVGTVSAGSGLGMGAPLADVGFDTPGLRGVWHTPPYLHDGSAETLEDALVAHGEIPPLDDADRADLLAYLRALDDTSLAADADCALADECLERVPQEGEGEGEGEGESGAPSGCGCGAVDSSFSLLWLALLALRARRNRFSTHDHSLHGS